MKIIEKIEEPALSLCGHIPTLARERIDLTKGKEIEGMGEDVEDMIIEDLDMGIMTNKGHLDTAMKKIGKEMIFPEKRGISRKNRKKEAWDIPTIIEENLQEVMEVEEVP